MRAGYVLCLLILPALASCTIADPGVSKAELKRQSEAYASEAYPVRMVDRSKFAARFQPAVAAAPAGYRAGNIVIDTRAKQLYLIGTGGKARRYGIAVGKSGYAWSGKAKIGRMAAWPAWYPTDDMHRQTPHLVRKIRSVQGRSISIRTVWIPIIAFTAPLNPGQLAPRPPPVASACSTRT